VSKFRQSDLTRALKGAIAAGIKISAVEIDLAGKIVIMTGPNEQAASASALDEWMCKHADQAQGNQ
jgi:hypothetical protein